MKTIRLLALAALALFPSFLAQAQFAPGQPLTASGLNAALARPTIVGGSIDGAPIGATTPSSGKFTSLTITGGFTGLSGALNVGNGLVGAPSLYFGDPTTGFYRPALDQIGFTIAGVANGFWSSTGLNGANIGATTRGTGAFTTGAFSGQITSTVSTGTAPLVIASTTNVPNLNASLLGGATFAAPGPIGSGTASTGAFTTASASTSLIAPLVQSSTGAATNLVLEAIGGATVSVKANGTSLVQVNSAGLSPVTDNTLSLGASANRYSALFSPIIDSGTTGSLSLKTNNGQTGFRVDNRGATAVNMLATTPFETGSGPILGAVGSDTNIDLLLTSAGTKSVRFFTGTSNTGGIVGLTEQFSVLHTASATRNITVTGSNGGNPTIATTAGSLAITPPLVLAGSSVSVPAGGFSIGDNTVAGSLFFDNAALGRTIITGKDHIRFDITGGVEKARFNSGGSLVFTTAATKIIPGATSLALRNNADSADNLICTDAGNCTIRGTASAAAGGTLAANADVQTFTASGTWTKPTGAKVVQVIAVGAGGGGGGGDGGAAATGRGGGGGGGGGVTVHGTFNAADVGATETITVGTGGTAGTGGSSAAGGNGGTGGNSSFGTKLIAYGGGNGTGGQVGTTTAGGGGGGSSAAGSGSTPGFPGAAGAASAGGGGGGGSLGSTPANFGFGAEYGGGGGGGNTAAQIGLQAGRSVYGGGGGGGAGGVTTANGETLGGVGGASGGGGSVGGGGTAGAVTGGAGGAGAAGAAIIMGAGGGGGGGNASGTGGLGGAGGAPGGGGGGGGGGTTTGGGGGVGGRGEVRVYTYF